MKLVKSIAIIGLGLLLTACGRSDYEVAKYHVSPIEKAMFKAYDGDFFINSDRAMSYEITIQKMNEDRISNVRSAKAGNGFTSTKPDMSKYPFCDYYDEIKKDELAYTIQYPDRLEEQRPKFITNQFKNTYGNTMERLCGVETAQSVTVVPTQVVVIDEDKTMSGEVENVLEPALYDRLIAASKTCNRAKVKLIGLTDNKQFLTDEDYSDVMLEVAKCKSYELERELQQ
ncbi:hypothetical protein VPHD479_0349 [Vibrio phage D479]